MINEHVSYYNGHLVQLELSYKSKGVYTLYKFSTTHAKTYCSLPSILMG